MKPLTAGVYRNQTKQDYHPHQGEFNNVELHSFEQMSFAAAP